MISKSIPPQPRVRTGRSAFFPTSCPACARPFRWQQRCPVDGEINPYLPLFGDYRLRRKLSFSPRAACYAAERIDDGTPVAIKFLPPPVDAEQFTVRCERRAALQHAHLSPLLDWGHDDSGAFLVCRWVEGASLSELWQDDGLDRVARLEILCAVLSALAALHRSGLQHGKLELSHIVIDGTHATLIDHGGADDLSRDRVDSQHVERLDFAAPEQLPGDRQPQPSADVYAFGVLAHRLLTRTRLFRADSAVQLVAEKLTVVPTVDLPHAALNTIVGRCLDADPQMRFASALEIQRQLESSTCLERPTPRPDHPDRPADLAGTVTEAEFASEDHRQEIWAGSYRLLSLLGSGALGAVWLAEHPLIGSRVAVKILHPQARALPDAVQRFVVEAQAVNRIDSPHIVRTFDFGKLADGRDYAVMELLEGETLAAHLRREGPMRWATFLPLFRQLAEALIAAHRAGIVHRDLKPDNIFLSTDQQGLRAKVLDFGVAKLLDQDATQTELGLCVGTPLYAPAEQITGKPVAASFDIYALGAVAFEALSGRPIFTGCAKEILGAKLWGALPDIGALPLSPQVAALLTCMLASEPEQRPTAAAVRQALELLGKVDPASATVASFAADPLPPTLPPRAATLPWSQPPPTARTWFGSAVIGLVSAALATAAMFWLTQSATVGARLAQETRANPVVQLVSAKTTAAKLPGTQVYVAAGERPATFAATTTTTANPRSSLPRFVERAELSATLESTR